MYSVKYQKYESIIIKEKQILKISNKIQILKTKINKKEKK